MIILRAFIVEDRWKVRYCSVALATESCWKTTVIQILQLFVAICSVAGSCGKLLSGSSSHRS